MNKSVSLSQQQIACLLANAFFCTFPRRNTRKRNNEYSSYPHINFSSLYECRGSTSVLEKLKCLCHYFRKVCTKVPVGVVTVWRRSAGGPGVTVPAWGSLHAPIAALPLHVDSNTTIEDAHGLIQVDFANRFLGGGVLTYGCVQEEIRFIICPELLITMLFTEMMKPDEAVLIIGSERYSEYSGYSNSFRWTGDYKDSTPYDSSGRRRCAVLAIDAKPYQTDEYQYRMDMIDRELTKAWVGFSFHTEGAGCAGCAGGGARYPGVGTGNWGCGAYRGSPRLKSLLQAMACVACRRPMAYYTFGDHLLRDHIVAMYNLLSRHNVTVAQLYKYLEQYSKMDIKKTSLYTFLSHAVQSNATKDEPEMMEISTSPEKSKLELSGSLQKEFLKDFESPDMFSEPIEPLVEVIVDTEPQDVNDEGSGNQTKLIDEMKRNVPNPSVTPVKNEKSNTSHQSVSSRLIDEMQKLDNEGKSTSPTQQRRSLNHDIHSPMKNKPQCDATAEMKKRVNKKITDYFSKKT